MDGSQIIERLLKLCGVATITDLASKTGVPYNTLKNYASAKTARMPSSEVLATIAQTTGVNLNWLLLGEGEPYGIQVKAVEPDVLKPWILTIRVSAFNVQIELPLQTPELLPKKEETESP